MTRLSNRLQTLTGSGSDGWDVFYRARALAAAGEEVCELTVGEHDIRTHPDILAALERSARGGHTGYAMVPGIPALRDRVAARVSAQTGCPTTRDNVLITPGGQAALFAAHMAACEPKDRALFIDPYYATYPGTIRAAGAEPHPVAALAEKGFQPDPDALAKAAPNAVSLLINSPNNPTGAVYGAGTMQMIAEICTRNDLWLISDEVYDGQVWDGAHLSPRALPGMADRTLVVGSMSKSFAMTGSRIGWVVGPEQTIAGLINLATHTTYGVPGYIQDAALWALTGGAELEVQVAEPFRRRRTAALARLAHSKIVRHAPPQGAMYLMLDIRATGLSGTDFANRLLDTHRIAVMPGESFGNAAAGHLRVAMTIPDDAFLDALDTIIRFAEETGQ